MLIKERAEELIEFYALFLDNAKEFIITCDKSSVEKNNAWVMLNQTQRLIYLADNADKIKQSRDAFKVLFLIICAEVIAKLYKNFEDEGESKKYVKIFFEEICSLEDFNSLSGAIITDKPKSPTVLSSSEFVDFMYDVRCSLVHEGRYWEFSFKDESKLGPFFWCCFAKTEATVVVGITYQKLRNIIVKGAIRAIQMYLSNKNE